MPYNNMSEAHKKHKGSSNKKLPDFGLMCDDLLAASMSSNDHPFVGLLEAIRTNKKPILQTVPSQNEVYKSNPEKKKKPI